MADDVDLKKYLQQKSQPVAQSGRLSDTMMQAAPNQPSGDVDLNKYLQEKTGQAPAEEPGMLHKGLDIAGRVLDYPGGYARTGLASVAGLLGGKTDVVKEDDLKNMVKGKAPNCAEYLGRLGVPEGPSMHVPFTQDMNISARDVGGFGLDVATDPLTAGARALKGLPYVGRALGLVGEGAGHAAEAMGENAYKSGFKKIDERLVEKGKTPLSDVLLESGAPTGTTKKISEKTAELADAAGKERGQLYNKAQDLGVSVDLGYPLPKTEQALAKISSKPTKAAQGLATDLSDMVGDFKNQGKVGLEKLSDWKTGLTDDLPQSAFSGAKVKGGAKRVEKALASDFRDAIVEAGNKGEAGLGDAIDKVNDKWGSLIEAKQPLAMQVRRGNTPHAVSSVDAILAHVMPGALPFKKGADLAKTTWARTNIGKGLMNLGESGAVDPTVRRGLINLLEEKEKKKSKSSPDNSLLPVSQDQ